MKKKAKSAVQSSKVKEEQSRLTRKQAMLDEAKELALLNGKLRTNMRRLAIKVAG